ncbi:MAG: histidine phosphatase family protein [Acidimicrobiia bacterium]
MKVIHLVRHGEVANPNHVVYADLPGFSLSPKGVLQAHRTGRHLREQPIDAVVSSPLQRAQETATAIVRHHDVQIQLDQRLIESGQYPEWTGLRWDDVHDRFSDQIGTYLADATKLDDVQETVDDIARRTAAAALEILDQGASTVVLVSHQDPVNAAFLHLSGGDLSSLRIDPPAHASVVTLRGDRSGWAHVGTWEPDQ